MDELTLIFLVIVAGILLGMACNTMSASDEGKVDAAQADQSASQPAPDLSEAPALAPADLNTKDCRSCGGHSQPGRLCSFCGRAL
jgi:hypothetical protein